LFDDGVEFTLVEAGAALDAGSLIDDVNFLYLAADAVNGADFGA
jgi:hypothetical protein